MTETDALDMDLSREILDAFNAGHYDRFTPIRAEGIPVIDGRNILDINAGSWILDGDTALQRARDFDLPAALLDTASRRGRSLTFSASALFSIGVRLYPLYSPGVLNGGSATSYLDRIKNRSFNPDLFDLYADVFEAAATRDAGKPKGIVPAYMNSDGSPGFSFMELRMRSMLIEILRYGKRSPGTLEALYPLFQMTSIHTHDALAEAYKAYAESPALKDLLEAVGIDILTVKTEIQGLITAYTHSREGKPKNFFTRNRDGKDTFLPLPGGHGQNFRVLKDIYHSLYRSGKRFISLGNVDNLGYTPNPVYLALFCLSGRNAAFEFSFRTPVDVKGGILVTDQFGKLNCGDIGVAVSKEDVEREEKAGKAILFNCATGIFDLEYLTGSLDHIIANLPVRFSDQEKDTGAYSQAEQVTWEVLGMIENPLIFSVNKFDRFLASKLFIENLLTSGFRLQDPRFPRAGGGALAGLSARLSDGLFKKLSGAYGMSLRDGRWIPLSVKDILEKIKKEQGV